MTSSVSLIKPAALQADDCIGLIAPASGVPREERIDAGVAFLESKGLKVKLGEHARSRKAKTASGGTIPYLATDDAARAADLNAMWRDPEVKAIWCLRGGYGTARMLDLVDYEYIRENPKIFIGFSDITNLHLALQKRAGLLTVHGPMAAAEFAQSPLPDYTWNTVWRLISSASPLGWLREAGGADAAAPIVEPKVLAKGKGSAAGPLTGGNLAHLQSSLATPDAIDTSGKIVFIEDVGERPYRIDRMLTHLLAAGKLSDAAGIALGLFDDCRLADDPSPEVDGEGRHLPTQALLDVFEDRLGGLGIPVIYGLPFSHTVVNGAIPYGVTATLDPKKRDLRVDESAVI